MGERDYRATFGQRLKELRLARGLNQEDLAAQAGVDRTYISQAERGVRNPTLGTMTKLAKALDVDVTELLTLQAESK